VNMSKVIYQSELRFKQYCPVNVWIRKVKEGDKPNRKWDKFNSEEDLKKTVSEMYPNAIYIKGY